MSSRLGKITITHEELRGLLGVTNATVKAVAFNSDTLGLDIILESENFHKVIDGGSIPPYRHEIIKREYTEVEIELMG